MALQGYFAGVNTVAYLYSFMLRALLDNPAVLARVTAEAGTEPITWDRLRHLPALRGLVLETLRVYPPAPGSARTVTTAFDFEGFHIARPRTRAGHCASRPRPAPTRAAVSRCRPGPGADRHHTEMEFDPGRTEPVR